MAWIRTVAENEAEGDLKALYDAAVRRAGRVFNIVRVMSPSPATLAASMDLYMATMFRTGVLPRAICELLATHVSRINNCHY